MSDCFAIGIGYVVKDGACTGDGPSLDEAVQALEEAIDDAEIQASKSCPKGHKCVGVAVPLGPPVCRTVHVRDSIWCICSVQVSLQGQCEAIGKGVKPKKVQKSVDGEDIRDFFRKVADLPELPAHPVGRCQMYKQQKGHGFWYPICRGSCEKGDCQTRIEVFGGSVRAYCVCE